METGLIPTKDNLKTLHKTIKFSDHPPAISSGLPYDLCQRIDSSRLPFPKVLTPWLSLFPHMHHIAEELWSLLGKPSARKKLHSFLLTTIY
jgi:hypothetical protein